MARDPVRSQRRAARPDPTAGLPQPEGFTVDRADRWAPTVLTWSVDGVSRTATFHSPVDAIHVARMLCYPLAQVLHAWRDPDGAPLMLPLAGVR